MKYLDYELVATNYDHPDIKTGMHTNGPATIWFRYKDGPWIKTNEKHMHKVRQAIDDVEVLAKILEQYESA